MGTDKRMIDMHPDHCHQSSDVFEHIILSDDLSTEIMHVMEARHATQSGDLVMLRQLIDDGVVTVDSVDADDCSLLHWAAINNKIEIAKFLISRKCNVNAVGGVLASTPLHWAAHHGHNSMIAFLVKNGANCYAKDVEGFTPLHIAAQFGFVPVMAFFIASGQSPDTPDDSQMTPAMWVAYKVANVCPLRTLALLSADLEKCDGTHGNTALHLAVMQANYCAIDTLLRLNVNPEPMNKAMETPLDIAKVKNDLLAIKLIELALRERGLVPSTWRQRLRESKTVARNILIILPFITTFCGAYVFDSTMDYISKAELLTLLGICSMMIIRYFINDQRADINTQHLLTGVVTSSKLFLIVGWIVFLHPVVPFFMQIVFFVLTLSVTYTFCRLLTDDPGFVHLTQKERCAEICELMDNENFDEFCTICLSFKAPRTHHCRLCNKCVRMHDHHCPWLSRCVGESNHLLFFVYLIMLDVTNLLIFIGCLYYWYEMCGEISSDNVVFCRPWVLIMNWMSFSFFVWMIVMTIMQFTELLSRYFHTKSTFRNCAFNVGGNKINVRSRFSRRCRLLRRICTSICSITPRNTDYYSSNTFGATQSSIRIKNLVSSYVPLSKRQESKPLL